MDSSCSHSDTTTTLPPLLKSEILPIQIIGPSSSSCANNNNNTGNRIHNIRKPTASAGGGKGGLLRDYTKSRDDHYGKSPVHIGRARDLYGNKNNNLLDSFLLGIGGSGSMNVPGSSSRDSGSSNHTAPTLPMTDDSDSTCNSSIGGSGGGGGRMQDVSGDSLGSTSTNNYLPSLLKQPKKSKNQREPTLFLEQRRVSQTRVSTVLERVDGFDMMDMSSSTVGSNDGDADDELLFLPSPAEDASTMEDESMTYSELCGPRSRSAAAETASESDDTSESSSGYSFGGDDDDDEDKGEASLNLSSLMRSSCTSFASEAATTSSGKNQSDGSHQQQKQNKRSSAGGGGQFFNQTTVRSASNSLLDTACSRKKTSSSSCHARRKENSSLNSLLDSGSAARASSLHVPRTRSSAAAAAAAAALDSSRDNNNKCTTHERRRQHQPQEKDNKNNLTLNKSTSLHTPRTQSLLSSLDSIKKSLHGTSTNNGSSHERRLPRPSVSTANFRSMQLPSKARASSTGTTTTKNNMRRTSTIPSCNRSSSNIFAATMDRRSSLLASTRGIQSMSNLGIKKNGAGNDSGPQRPAVPQVSFRIRKRVGRSSTFDASASTMGGLVSSQHDRWNQSLRGLQMHAGAGGGGSFHDYDGGGSSHNKASKKEEVEAEAVGPPSRSEAARRGGNGGPGLRRAKTFDDRIGSMSFRRLRQGLNRKNLNDDGGGDDKALATHTANTTDEAQVEEEQNNQNNQSSEDMKRHSIHGTLSSSCGRPTSLLCPQERLNRSLRNVMAVEERERLQCSWGTQMAKMGTLSTIAGSGTGGGGGRPAVPATGNGGGRSNVGIETALSAAAVGAVSKCRSQFIPSSSAGRSSFTAAESANKSKSWSNLHKATTPSHDSSSNDPTKETLLKNSSGSGVGRRTSLLISFGQHQSSMRSIRSSFTAAGGTSTPLDRTDQLISFGQQQSSMRSVRSSFSGGTGIISSQDLDSSSHHHHHQNTMFTGTRIRRITTNASLLADSSSSKDSRRDQKHSGRQTTRRRGSMSALTFSSSK